MMRYLRGTKELILILSADSTNIVKWWFDGSYGTHPDARSQTGGTASLGKGYFMSTLINQRLNIKLKPFTLSPQKPYFLQNEQGHNSHIY